MRHHRLLGTCGGAILSVLLSTPACAQSAWSPANTKSAAVKWELSYLTLSAIDAAETISCLDRGICEEGNPLFGRHPSATKVILVKAGLGLMHFALFNRIKDRNPKAALRLAQVSVAAQGAVVGLNARFVFK